MSSEIVSVVMPVYNTAGFVGAAIESVLCQDYPRFELVIVDDGSTDGGHEIVQDYTDPRIHLIRDQNRGPSAARNRGFEESRGTYITFLDSDDLLTPNSLSSRVIALQQTGAEAGFSRNFDKLFEDGSIRAGGAIDSKPWTSWKRSEVISMMLDGCFSFAPWSFMVHRRLFQEIGGFDTSLRCFEDLEFTSRLVTASEDLVETYTRFYAYRRRRNSVCGINSCQKARESLCALRKFLRNLDQYSVGRENEIAQLLFAFCVYAYPYWTHEHSQTMAEANRLRGERPFDLACVGGDKAQAVAGLLGWRAAKIVTVISSYFRQKLLKKW